MASAASLNAAATIMSGGGLYVNQGVQDAIASFRNQPTIQLISTIFTNAQLDSNVANVVIPELSQLGNSSVSRGQWLIDLYPSGNTAVATGSVVYYGNGLPSFSQTINSQVMYPFSGGAKGSVASMLGFASMWTTAYGYANQVFDLVGSVHMLKNKTYGQSGLGYTGLVDSVTGGVGPRAPLIGNVISGWGTMYNITKINLIADPYVFGQNLLDHGLGSYGDLSAKLEATGLDVTDLTRVPSSTKVTIQQESTQTTTTFVGPVDLPSVVNVTSTNTVTGNNPSVVKEIYSTITGANLSAIISATGFTQTNNNLKTLADFLDFNKVVGPSLATQLAEQGIYNFNDFGSFLQNKIKQLSFASWSELSSFLLKIKVPEFVDTITTSSTPVLSPSTVTTITNSTGSGSGPFNNPVMLDYFGATSGNPYTSEFDVLASNYSSIVSGVYTAVNNLNSAIININLVYAGLDSANISANGVGGMVASNVIAVNNAINSAVEAANQTVLTKAETSYHNIIAKTASEVASLSKAEATINTAFTTQFLMGFGQGIGSYTDDTVGAGEIVANLITADSAGDTIRAAVAESTNATIIAGRNEANPRTAVYQSQTQNIPLTTYINQNQ